MILRLNTNRENPIQHQSSRDGYRQIGGRGVHVPANTVIRVLLHHLFFLRL